MLANVYCIIEIKTTINKDYCIVPTKADEEQHLYFQKGEGTGGQATAQKQNNQVNAGYNSNNNNNNDLQYVWLQQQL
jgi:hypothetical protein